MNTLTISQRVVPRVGRLPELPIAVQAVVNQHFMHTSFVRQQVMVVKDGGTQSSTSYPHTE